MKKMLLFIFLVHIVSCFGGSAERTGLEGKRLPSFKLLLIDSITTFNTINISGGKPIVLFYFSPFCPFCEAQTEEIIANIKSLSNIQFYMFANSSFQELKDYYIKHQLKKYPNIIVGQAYDSYFVSYFKPAVIPYMVIYAKDKREKGVLVGKTDIQQIKDIVK